MTQEEKDAVRKAIADLRREFTSPNFFDGSTVNRAMQQLANLMEAVLEQT